jgi:chloramphenicol-sensitive protein RarD
MNAAITQEESARRGLAYGLAAYGLWGVLPIYFKAVDTVPAIEIVAHRVLWRSATEPPSRFSWQARL